MAESLISYFRRALPAELAESLGERITLLENGDYESVFSDPLAASLLRDEEESTSQHGRVADFNTWSEYIFQRLGVVMARRTVSGGDAVDQTPLFRSHLLFIIGLSSLYAFMQSTMTGPPLPFESAKLLFPQKVATDPSELSRVRSKLIDGLKADGEAAYPLIHNVELFCLADAIFDFPPVRKNVEGAAWAKLRVDFTHQRLLNGVVPSLQDAIYQTLPIVEQELLKAGTDPDPDTIPCFVLERATIHTHHGFDTKAKTDLDKAVELRRFQFALTGLLGKRTKFQEKDVSQLVVLARSYHAPESKPRLNGDEQFQVESSKPENLDLNDDTLLERISFAETVTRTTDIQSLASLAPELKALDPANQPLLQPIDSIILLSLASSIKNTSPEDGLTREETLPYATRVLEGGSSNWQIYTQALLVRSRIEGYRSRTIERGLLQLQTLVDQVITETTGIGSHDSNGEPLPTTFLPRAKSDESAPVSERLRYLFQLASPSRWELEAELAQRWVTMGGLRSALEIYERLHMWAEVALCWAATEREDKATRIVRRQLFHSTAGNDEAVNEDEETWQGAPRDPPPADAPRLYCILGDIDQDPTMYEKAWEVSNSRYARAQRSLGRLYFTRKDYDLAASAYQKSLKANQLSHSSWFALGCAYLELARFTQAVEAFTRTVQLDDTDAEAWSNLAAALLSINRAESATASTPSSTGASSSSPAAENGEEEQAKPQTISSPELRQKRLRDALNALKQASKLQFSSHRILENLLTVAASTSPPSYSDVFSAQSRLIDLRGPSEGERCIDVGILDLLVRHVIVANPAGFDAGKPGVARMTVEMVDKKVVPLITASAPLWDVVARLAVWRGRPVSALGAREKAWRAVISQPGWEFGAERGWDEVVDRTVDLVDAYETFGPVESTEGLSGGTGAVVMKDWKFKARTAVRGILGRGKGSFEGTAGWEMLQSRLDDLKSA